MWKDSARVSLAASHWVAAVSLMVMASMDEDRLVLAGWSVLFALGGCVFAGWQMLTCERTRVETIAKLVNNQRAEPQGLHQVPQR